MKASLRARSNSPSTKKKSSLTKTMKRYSKQSLRAILLSHTFHKGFHIAVIAMVVSLSLYGAYAYIGKSVANEVVISKAEIIGRIQKHIALPEGEVYAVVRVENPEELKRQNGFYGDVQSGDYIVMYKSVAVIYDLKNDNVRAAKYKDR